MSLQNNHIYHMDGIEGMKKIADKSVDLILCDLPYGVTRNKWDVVIPFDKLWEQYKRIIKENGAIVLTAVQPFASQLVLSNPQWFRYEWIWEKPVATGFLNAKKMPMRAHENVLIFYKKLPTYHPQKTTGHPKKTSKASSKARVKPTMNYNHYQFTDYESTERYPRSVQVFKKDKGPSLHPTQKPLSLLTYLIRTYTNEGEVVLDNCMGSGSTAIACLETNRVFIGFEKDEKIAKGAKHRIAAWQEESQSNNNDN